VDGDTIECSRVGRIRLIGMDTPELSQAPFGARAADALEALISCMLLPFPDAGPIAASKGFHCCAFASSRSSK